MEKSEKKEMNETNEVNETNETNEMTIAFSSISRNESFARIVVAAFVTQLDPNMEEISDIKTAVSEAVTNAIIHGYDEGDGKITIHTSLKGNTVTISVIDEGKGIDDIEKAKEPLYTTKPELERSGMGFSFMEAFMNELEVESTKGKGTKVTMMKVIGE